MNQYRERLIFPLDVPTQEAARQWVTRLHAHVGMFKVGLELFIRCGPDLVRWIADHTDCGIFLDLKLHDIPATVERAMRSVADLSVALATVHCGENQSMLAAAVAGSGGKVDVLGVTVLTSVAAADLLAAGYDGQMAGDVTRLALHKAAMAKAAGCAGIVCSGQEVARIKQQFGADFLAVTPGIRPDWGAGRVDDQKRVVTPAAAIADGSDYLVIGRPIRDAADPVAAARRIVAEIDAGQVGAG